MLSPETLLIWYLIRWLSVYEHLSPEERPELSCRELALYIVDQEGWFVSESTVYRILKSRGLITTPAYRLMEAAEHYVNPTLCR